MTKHLSCIIFIVSFLSLQTVTFAQSAYTLFIATDGNDQSSGDQDNPIKTIEEALIRIKKKPNSIKQVFLRGGDYPIHSSIQFGAAHSGEVANPIIFSSYNREKVILSGGITIDPENIKKVKDPTILERIPASAQDHLLEIDLSAYSISYAPYGPRGFNRPYISAPNELFINEVAQQIARWPNLGEPSIKIGDVINPGSVPRDGDFSNSGAVFKWNTDRPKRWTKANNVYLSGFFKWGYADDAIPVRTIDQTSELFDLKVPHLYGVGNERQFNTWFAINLLEEIDVPGEYYIDSDRKKIYFYPSTRPEAIKSIQISTFEDPMLSFKNASFITFEGIIFENSRGMGVYIEEGESITIKNSVFRNLGTVAITIGKGIEKDTLGQHSITGTPASDLIGSLYTHLYKNPLFNRQGGKNHLIESCDIYNMGAGGIILGGGDRKTLTPANNTVSNCHIYQYNRLDRTYKSAVNIDGVGNVIRHSLIHDAPGNAIYLLGNNHVIEYNEIHHVMMDGDDQSAFYLGRDPSAFNNIVRYNYFHQIGISPTTHSTWTIYYDDGASGSIAYGNVFNQAGKAGVFLIGGGKYNKVFNNVFVNNNLVFHIDDRNNGWAKAVLDSGGIFEERLSLVNISQPPYSAFYPELKNYWNDHPELPSNEIKRNIFFNNKKLVDREFETTTWQDNWEATQNPGFLDYDNGNFNFSENAEVFNAIPNFEDVPFNRMGLQENSFRNTSVGKDGRIVPLPPAKNN
ncbi:right-handed parallel beta-helix repeat-containing protein [Algoriphagus aquimarinus]|uniref:Right handed beta helix region n=1 Tax=Algoriphagus aquimarinus TaxID=237018 RepID=A0A1I1A8B7_9BACT|nr:right-handed parallel beta-helix repeat-containing protein [Algoriphagus aquimarinus]SFB32653.1 Right handed beta helix region [Algoriphagus aquimarinus]